MKKSLLTLLCCWICFSATSQTLNLDSLQNAKDAEQKALVGKSFSFPELVTLTGERITPSSLKEKIVVYNMWFTSCSPCVAEIPALNKLKKGYNSDVVFIGVTFESANHVKKFLTKHPFDFKMATISKDELEKKIRFGYPTTIVVNKQGKIAYVTSGGATDHDGAEYLINQTLKPAIDKALAE